MKLHAFVAMPFGQKKGPDGTDIDFNAIYKNLLKPTIEAAGLEVFRADYEPRGGDCRTSNFAVKAKLEPERPPRCMPKELGESLRDPYERYNLWLLYTALAQGPEKVRFVCLCNGERGDGPGGTHPMMQEVKKRTGQVVWLKTRELR